MDLYKRIPLRYMLGMESQITAEYMWKRGVNNVRGSQFSQPREFTTKPADLEALVGFLGHYNNLSFEEVRKRLRLELPSPSPNFNNNKKKKRKNRKKRQLMDEIEQGDELKFDVPYSYEDMYRDEFDEDEDDDSYLLLPLLERPPTYSSDDRYEASLKELKKALDEACPPCMLERPPTYGEQVEAGINARPSSANWVDTARCFNCQQIGHLAKDCPQDGWVSDKQCYNCGEMGHLAADCPTTEGKRCFKCGEWGHFARDCDVAKSKCFICGSTKHKGYDCPKAKRALKGP